MEDIGVGSILIRSDHYYGSIYGVDATSKGFVGIVESMKIEGAVTLVKFKGMKENEFCLDNFKVSKNTTII